MWLIKTDTLELKWVNNEQNYKYAILSHQWATNGEVEVSFQDMKSIEQARKKPAFFKISGTQLQAKKDSLEYFWVDTCCIDKSSSSELQEAINSMYRWYANAAVCYAYLSDVDIRSGNPSKSFGQSRWFTRGWTLQELLAPKTVKFFENCLSTARGKFLTSETIEPVEEGVCEWRELGNKETLAEEIAAASGIDIEVLKDNTLVHLRSVAERMSWASRRETTRKEDEAYCLLGIFDVSLPMSYGIKERAFLQLQEEIIKLSDDHSIFAWSGVEDGSPGLLARSPSKFINSRYFRMMPKSPRIHYEKQCVNTRFSLTAYSLFTFSAQLSCFQEPGKEPVEIYLRRFPGSEEYARVKPSKGEDLTLVREKDSTCRKEEPVTVVQIMTTAFKKAKYFSQPTIAFRFSGDLCSEAEGHSESTAEWEKVNRLLILPNGMLTPNGMLGSLDLHGQDSVVRVVRLGFNSFLSPVCMLAQERAIKSGETTGTKLAVGAWECVKWLTIISTLGATADLIPVKTTQHRGKGVHEYTAETDISDRMDSKKRFRYQEKRKGLWILEGNSIEGLDAIVTTKVAPGANQVETYADMGGISRHMPHKRAPFNSSSKERRVTILPGVINGQPVWDVCLINK